MYSIIHAMFYNWCDIIPFSILIKKVSCCFVFLSIFCFCVCVMLFCCGGVEGGGINHIFFKFYHFTASLISTQSVKHFLFLMSVSAPTPR